MTSSDIPTSSKRKRQMIIITVWSLVMVRNQLPAQDTLEMENQEPQIAHMSAAQPKMPASSINLKGLKSEKNFYSFRDDKAVLAFFGEEDKLKIAKTEEQMLNFEHQR
ncbi:hypothetical protein WN51_12728 [Melipona quadrifasciata]|uniref:Uncharacterized protein n=1 Tax=Melipona quadrifasciata TaxID=166423 RepID=A0A0M9A396_9HYME|nr:hypothetical protein WN51_12728 [Melipona quadrifasciata]